MNFEIKKMCERNNFTFVDFFTDYADKNGALNPAISDGDVHIRFLSNGTKQFIATQIHKIVDASTTNKVISVQIDTQA